jgi:hypothetical protein
MASHPARGSRNSRRATCASILRGEAWIADTIVPANVLNCLRLAVTLEVFDGVIGRFTTLFPPNPIVPGFGALGVTAGDTIRLNVAFPPQPVAPANPCTVRASFLPLNAAGALEQTTLTLSAGQTDALEFSAASLGLGAR